MAYKAVEIGIRSNDRTQLDSAMNAEAHGGWQLVQMYEALGIDGNQVVVTVWHRSDD
jgi:hypothetical protein